MASIFIGRSPKTKNKEGLYLFNEQVYNRIEISSIQEKRGDVTKKIEGINHIGVICEKEGLIPFEKIDRINYKRIV